MPHVVRAGLTGVCTVTSRRIGFTDRPGEADTFNEFGYLERDVSRRS